VNLLTNGSASPKIIKSDKSGLGYLSSILYLLPHKLSGNAKSLCPSSSEGCRNHCLNYSGRGYMSNVIRGRKRKTDLFFTDRVKFLELLHEDITKFTKRCTKLGFEPAIRLNGLSDLAWEKLDPSLFSNHPSVQYYDYTKIYKRMLGFLNGDMPKNYHLTFSRHELNDAQVLDILAKKGNVAVVFKTKNYPKVWNGFKTFNGDLHDLRFVDKPGVCALYAKGKAKKDDSGFVIPTLT
jgi:hypothetical protein